MKEKRRYAMTKRATKAEAARARIRAAAALLYSERPVEDFTIEEVATRAGVSVRTVLRAYPSKDDLVLAALSELAATGDWQKRLKLCDVAEAVKAHFEVYEGVGGLVLRLLDDEGRRPALKPMLDQGRKNHRDGLQIAFAAQLASLKGAARKELLTMLVILTDVYVWKLLRRDMGYGRSAAEAIVRKMVDHAIEGRKQ